MGMGLLLLVAVLQGLTEFLPVSSSGHLVAAAELFDLGLAGRGREAFFVLLHGASLLAVLVGLAPTWLRLLRDGAWQRTLAIAVLGTLPAAVAGLGLRAAGATGLFESLGLVAAGWAVTALVLRSTRGRDGQADPFDGAFPMRLVLLVGAAQAFALVPGISRSGVTIAAALLLGTRRREAFELSFLLAIPAIGGALLLDAGELGHLPGSAAVGSLVLAFVAAFVVSLAALLVLRRVVERERLHVFAPYCALLAIATVVYLVLAK